LRWRDGSWSPTQVDKLAPGDMIVVPSSLGGCDAWGWDPESSVEVPDLGTEAHYFQRSRGAIRFSSATLRNALAREAGTEAANNSGKRWAEISFHVEEQGEEIEPIALCRYLQEAEGLPETWRKLLAAMEENDPDYQFYDDNDPSRGFVLFSGEPLNPGLLTGGYEDSDEGSESITGQEDSSSIGAEVTLADHHRHVADRALNLARRSGLSDRMAHLVELPGAFTILERPTRVSRLISGDRVSSSLGTQRWPPPSFGRECSSRRALPAELLPLVNGNALDAERSRTASATKPSPWSWPRNTLKWSSCQRGTVTWSYG